MTALAIGGYGLGEIGQIYGAISSYQSGVAAQNLANQTAQASLVASQNQAVAAQTEAQAQADEYNRQAKLEEYRAGVEQIEGEQEAEKRSRQLAASIGQIYANWAGNGLLVDGRASDTLGAALRTEVGEGQADISTIRDNTAMNVWTRQTNAASLKTSAANTLTAGYNAASSYLFQGLADAQSSIAQGRNSYRSGVSGLVTGLLGAGGTAAIGTASSIKTYDKYGSNWSKTRAWDFSEIKS